MYFSGSGAHIYELNSYVSLILYIFFFSSPNVITGGGGEGIQKA